MKLERYKVEMVNQLPFYTCPKLLIHNEYFNKISSDAKILYMVMQNRVLLSKENNWVDENDEVYIYLTIDEACELLSCSVVTARKAINQLKDIGLIEIVRQGLSKPNKIYINTMIEDEKVIFLNDKNKHFGMVKNNSQGYKNNHSRMIKNNSQDCKNNKNNHSRLIENNTQECKNLTPRNNNIRNNNIEIINSSGSSSGNNNNTTSTAVNINHKEYIKKYMKAINPVASSIEIQMLSTYEDDVEEELIEIAIEEAILNNVFKLNYIKAILDSCIKSNIKTAEQYRNMKQLRERKTKENENRFNGQNQRNANTTKPTAEEFRKFVGGEYL